MLKPYDLLKSVLFDIEEDIRKDINADILAKKYDMSERHLRRLFKFAFEQPLASYISSRKLSASLDELLKTDANLISIAFDYGFGYEQSYLRAFKREFGITPGDLRKTGHIVKVQPPCHLFDENKLPDGLIFKPEIVMVPQFHIAGKLHRIPRCNLIKFSAEMGPNFWINERTQIKQAVNSNAYIGLVRKSNDDNNYFEYMAAVQVDNFDDIPEGFSTYTFEASLCARFRYIGMPHNYDATHLMYETIRKFVSGEYSKYTLLADKVYFEKVDTSFYDETYCQMEWHTPVVEKIKNVRNCSIIVFGF
jgi:AraC family transcriptional regulator